MGGWTGNEELLVEESERQDSMNRMIIENRMISLLLIFFHGYLCQEIYKEYAKLLPVVTLGGVGFRGGNLF